MSYVLIKDVKYPFADTYSGYAERCIFEFSLGPEQLPGTQWIRDRIVDAFADKVAEEGAHMLELRVWEDTAPTWTTDYQVEAVATASPLAWNVIIYGALLIVLLIVVYYTIITPVERLWYGIPGDGGQPGIGETITGMLPMIIMMVMMMVMIPIMTSAFKGEEGPVEAAYKKVKTGAKAGLGAFKKLRK